MRHLEFGVFLPIAKNGFIVSTTTAQFMPSWELNRDVTVLCEENGFEFALSMIKHRGFGGGNRVLGLRTGLLRIDGGTRHHHQKH